MPHRPDFLDITLSFPQDGTSTLGHLRPLPSVQSKASGNPTLIRLIYRAEDGVISYAETL